MTLKLVANNSDEDRRRILAAQGLRGPLRQLTANLMRIVRGAGHAERLPCQIQAVTEAYVAYHEAFGCYPSSYEVQEALSLPDELPNVDSPDKRDDKAIRDALYRDRMEGARSVQMATLQILASTLLDQTPQRRSGERDFWASFYETREAHDAYRAAIDVSLRPSKKHNPRKPRRPAT